MKKENSIYGTSEIMRVIGQQTCWQYVSRKEYAAFMEAHTGANISSLFFDAFAFGYIYGIKAERAKRNKREVTTIM